VLIDMEPGNIWTVVDATMRIKGVKRSHAVAGQYDAVAYVEFAKMDDLGAIIQKIQRLEGVRRTQTLLAIPPTIREK
jgi:DNA-binding Lrp family transcriptional regulator